MFAKTVQAAVGPKCSESQCSKHCYVYGVYEISLHARDTLPRDISNIRSIPQNRDGLLQTYPLLDEREWTLERKSTVYHVCGHIEILDLADHQRATTWNNAPHTFAGSQHGLNFKRVKKGNWP